MKSSQKQQFKSLNHVPVIMRMTHVESPLENVNDTPKVSEVCEEKAEAASNFQDQFQIIDPLVSNVSVDITFRSLTETELSNDSSTDLYSHYSIQESEPADSRVIDLSEEPSSPEPSLLPEPKESTLESDSILKQIADSTIQARISTLDSSSTEPAVEEIHSEKQEERQEIEQSDENSVAPQDVKETAEKTTELKVESSRETLIRKSPPKKWRSRFLFAAMAASILWGSYIAVQGTTLDSLISSLLKGNQIANQDTATDESTDSSLSLAPTWQAEPVEQTAPLAISMLPTPFAMKQSEPVDSQSNAPTEKKFETSVDLVGPIVDIPEPTIAANAATGSNTQSRPLISNSQLDLPFSLEEDQIKQPLLTQQDLNIPKFDEKKVPATSGKKGSTVHPSWSDSLNHSNPQSLSSAENDPTSVSGHWMKQEPTNDKTKVDPNLPAYAEGLRPEATSSTNQSYSGSSQNTAPNYYAPLTPNKDDRRPVSQARLLGIEPSAPRTR